MSFESLNDAGLQSLRLKPRWEAQTPYLGAPIGAGSGVYLEGSPAALVHVALRERVDKRTARVVITPDLTTTTFTITIDGNNVAYNASVELPADATELIAGIAQAILADGTVNEIVTAVPDPDNPTTTVRTTGVGEADYSVDASVSGGGSGAIASITADPISATVRFFCTPGGTVKDGSTGNENGWVQPADGFWDITYLGMMEGVVVGGIARGYLGLYNIAKHASDGSSVTVDAHAVMIGPALE